MTDSTPEKGRLRTGPEDIRGRRRVRPRFGRGTTLVGEFLTDTWLPIKRRHVRATTAYRYAWFVDHYINPAIGQVPLRRLRADHLDGLYDELGTIGGRNSDGLAPKTIHEVHVIVRSSLDLAARHQLVGSNVAQATNARHRRQTRLRYHDYADVRVMPTLVRWGCSAGVVGLRVSA